ncbi:hypothetical protein [Microbacterium sp. NPDC078849]
MPDDGCELLGCDDVLTYEDEDTRQFECRRCGAEWWEDVDA